MKRILIIGFSKIKYMPYFNFYYENLNHKLFSIDVLYWNRDGKYEDLSNYSGCKFFSYDGIMSDNAPKYKKIMHFYKFRELEKVMLQSNKYDYVICLHTFSGMLISNLLINYYKYRYVFDYRDSTYEKYPYFGKRIKELSSNSLYTFVSSDGFRRFLPNNNNIITTHNILTDSLRHRKKIRTSANVIRIAFWGFIRDEKTNIAIIDRISVDKRFELHYYGKEQETVNLLKIHVRKNNISNVFFHGEYNPNDRYEFVKQTDLIHNVFFDENMMIAMGNKFYDGLIFYIPILCAKGSFMGQIATQSGIGLECSPFSDSFCEDVYHYYTSLNYDAFCENCDENLSSIMKEYENAKSIVNQIG